MQRIAASWLHSGSRSGWLILLFPVAVYPGVLAGTVADPQHRVIVGAQVTLSCGPRDERLATDEQGRFEFPARPPFKHCSLTVIHSGFVTFQQTLDENPVTLFIELRLAATRQVVQVRSKSHDMTEINRSSLGSVSLSDVDLKGISNNTEDLIRYAKAQAGADMAPDAVYVDGLPASTLPPPSMVGRIDVNTNPFSAEFSDNDRTHINIITKSADRKLHFNLGGAGLGVGGSNALSPGQRSVSHSSDLNLTGPIPRAPLTFSAHTSFGNYVSWVPIQALMPPGPQPEFSGRAAPGTGRHALSLLNVHYSRAESSQANFSYSESRYSGSNVGVGGLTLPEAGSASTLRAREARLTFTKMGPAYIYQGGLAVNEAASHIQANSKNIGIMVEGSLVAGGAALTSNRSDRTNWTLKNVFQSTAKRRSWTTGITVARSEISSDEHPNSVGVIKFSSLQAYADAQAGRPTGTLFVTRGNGRARYASLTAAPFLQGELLRSEKFILTGGLRGDFQTHGGILLSPRLSAAARKRGFVLRAGGGVFVHDWPGNIFLRAIEDDGLHLQPFILQNASLAYALSAAGESAPLAGPLVRARLAPNLTPPRDVMFKASAERSFGHLNPGVEYTWVDGLHLLGSRRLPQQQGWLDVVESNRARRRQQLHVSLRFTWKGQSLVGHYEWIQSKDNTAGPFSFPENQNDLRAEWAPTAGVSPHNFSLVDSIKLPGAISLTFVASSRSSAPYNLTSGLDGGNGLYNDRAGTARNSGHGPGYNSLSLYGYRRIPLPGIRSKPGKRIYVDLGFQADNLLGNRNYMNMDSVSSSPLFGKPLAASPGRSARFWFSFE